MRHISYADTGQHSLCGNLGGALVVVAAIVALSSCGGSSPPPQQVTPNTSSPSTAPTTAPPSPVASSQSSPPSSTGASTAPVSTGEAQHTEAAATSAPAPEQYPVAILTAPGTAFLVDYANSDVKAHAISKCDAEAKPDDPAAKAACLQKAREKFLPDVLVFKADKRGHATLTIYKRNETVLQSVFDGVVVLQEKAPTAVEVQFKSGKGLRPLFKGASTALIQMPNSYTVELDDPEWGHLRYDAKIGLVNN